MSRNGVRRCAICCCGNFPRFESSRWRQTRMWGFITGRRSKSIRRPWKRAKKRCSRRYGEKRCRRREVWHEARGNVAVLRDVFEYGSGSRAAIVKSTGKRRRRANGGRIDGAEVSGARRVARQRNCGGQPGPRGGDGGGKS